MSGDDKSMDEILKEIREIVAEDEGESAKHPDPDKDMSMSEILTEIRMIIAEDDGTAQPVQMIGFEVGLMALLPVAGLAILWGIMLNGWLAIAVPFDKFAGVILLFILVSTADTIFRRPDNRREWVILLTAALLAAMACTTAMSLTDWVLQTQGGDLQLGNWWPARLIAGLSALAATLWAASRLTRNRNLIHPKEGVARQGEAG